MGSGSQPTFPRSELLEDPAMARLVGLHPQRQEGLWMQRVKVPGGALSADQWRTLGRIARNLTPGTPLHLTTRQDVQVHDVTPERVGDVQRALADAGLTAVGAGGDTLRNIIVCPCSGLQSGKPDLLPFARQIQRTLEAVEGIRSLPRKFKISLSCNNSCGRPWISDLGLVADQRGSRWGFQVIVAGSLGARPGPGMQLFDWLPAEDVQALAVAAVDVFASHGDRQQRNRARLRHVRERLGDGAFARLLCETFERTRCERSWPTPELKSADEGFTERLTLNFTNGDVTPDVAEALADLAANDRLRLRIDTCHRVILFAHDQPELRHSLAISEALAQATRPQPTIVACPGTRWCPRALTDTNHLADRLRAELPADVTVCISGCPNGCAHSTVADIGLVGRLVTNDDQKVQVYDLWTGGGMGRLPRLATLVVKGLSPEEAVEQVAAQAR